MSSSTETRQTAFAPGLVRPSVKLAMLTFASPRRRAEPADETGLVLVANEQHARRQFGFERHVVDPTTRGLPLNSVPANFKRTFRRFDLQAQQRVVIAVAVLPRFADLDAAILGNDRRVDRVDGSSDGRSKAHQHDMVESGRVLRLATCPS